MYENENVCLWYEDYEEVNHGYYEVEAKEALEQFEKIALAVEQYELTDEQFNRLPDEAFPDDGELRYMSCDELEKLTDTVYDCISQISAIIAEFQ